MNRVLADEARELKVDQDPKVQAEIRNQTEKVLAKYRGQRFMKDLKPRDHSAAAREIYLTDPSKSTYPAAYKVWQVLIAITPSRDITQAKKRAEEARQRVMQGYDDLEAIARQLSDDPTAAKNGGVLDLLREAELDSTFAAAVKKLKPGETSPVIQTKFGFHVIHLLELLPEKKTKFEEIRSQLVEEARINYEKANYETHLARIREDPSLKLNTEALDAIRTKIPENFKPTYEPPATIKAPPRKPVATR